MTKPRMTPEQLAASKEGAERKRQIRRLWKSDQSLLDICEKLGLDEDAALALAASLGLSERPPVDYYLPTEEEIADATAAIRETWDVVTEQGRRTIFYGIINGCGT
jgi:hypothetical protein